MFKDIYRFYEQINKKNGNKLDLSAFKVDKDVAEGEKSITTDLKEDVIDDIIEELENLKQIVTDLKCSNMNNTIDELNYMYKFKLNIVKLNSVYLNLNTDFNDLHEFHTKFVQSLPEGPKDDSELIK